MFSLSQLHTKSLCVLALQNSQFVASTSSRPQAVNFEALGHKAIYLFMCSTCLLVSQLPFTFCPVKNRPVHTYPVETVKPLSSWQVNKRADLSLHQLAHGVSAIVTRQGAEMPGQAESDLLQPSTQVGPVSCSPATGSPVSCSPAHR